MTMYAFSIWGNTIYEAKEIKTVREMENYLLENYMSYLEDGFEEFIEDTEDTTEVLGYTVSTVEIMRGLDKSSYQDIMLDVWLHDYIQYKFDEYAEQGDKDDACMDFGELGVQPDDE